MPNAKTLGIYAITISVIVTMCYMGYIYLMFIIFKTPNKKIEAEERTQQICLDLYIELQKIQTKTEGRYIEVHERLQELKTLLQEPNVVTATITHYCPKTGGTNTDGDPTNTAFMKKPRVGRTLAISRDLYDIGWGGYRIYIPGFGIGVAEDLMSKDIKGFQIDICVKSEKEARRKGVRKGVIVTKIPR